MTSHARGVMAAIVAVLALVSAGCVEGGIGMGVPAGGARLSGPGPDVLVAGGPVYR